MLFTNNPRRNAFLLYCYYQFTLGILVVILTFIHPESEVFLIPSIIINLVIPAIVMYVARFRFEEAVSILIGINFISTTSYVITSAIDDQNALSSMLFLTYLIQAATLTIVFNKKVGLIYFLLGFLFILLKQLNVFNPYEFEFVYDYTQMEFMVFLTLYLVTLLKYIHIAISKQEVL